MDGVARGISASNRTERNPVGGGRGAWSGGRTECIALGATVQAISRCARHPVKIAQGKRVCEPASGAALLRSPPAR